MTMPVAEAGPLTATSEDTRRHATRWDERPAAVGANSAVLSFRNGTIDDFDPDACPDPFIPETPEEAAERLARTPRSPEGSQPAPTLADAMLDGNEGIGILRLMRDAAGTPFRAHGTWRSCDGVLSLSDTMAIGSSQRFRGVVHDVNDEYPIDIDVTITGHGDYRDAQGKPLRFVRFVSPEAVERADPSSWPATPPLKRVTHGI